jgi:hypothetical protein
VKKKKTPEEIAAYKREWAARNRERRNERARLRAATDPEWRAVRNARQQAWEKANRDRVNAVTRRKYHRDVEAARAKQRERYARKPAEQLAKTAAGIKAFRAANPYYFDARMRLWRSAKARAKAKGIEFALDPRDIVIPEFCPVLALKLTPEPGLKLCHTSPSLDRFDNDKGYIPGNVFVISWRANCLKRDATADEMAAVLRYMRRE